MDAVLGLFHRCYTPMLSAAGVVVWTRTALPAPGGMGQQPAWIMAALEFLCDVHQHMVERAAAEIRRKPKQRADDGD